MVFLMLWMQGMCYILQGFCSLAQATSLEDATLGGLWETSDFLCNYYYVKLRVFLSLFLLLAYHATLQCVITLNGAVEEVFKQFTW